MNICETLNDLAHELATCEYGAPTSAEYGGVTYRAKYEVDDMSIFDDGDWYGALAWVTTNRWTGHADPRPANFDGAARKLQRGGGDPVWWQPPADVERDKLDEMASTILDILEWGYHGLVVERCDGADFYGRPIVADAASLWGMAGYDRDGHAGVIAELLADVVEHEHVWGELQTSRFGGIVTRPCTVPGCNVVNGLDDDD